VAWTAARVAIAATLLAVAVVVVEPLREQIAAEIHDGYRTRFDMPPADTFRRMRAEAGGRPIACVGTFTLWPYYGRDFSGRPLYLPLDLDWREATRSYRFLPDPRLHRDRARWLDHLRSSGAAFVVVGPGAGNCGDLPIEALWCATDPARFEPAGPPEGCVQAYRVRGVPAAARP
jgi:hypothetical protein